jgi:hypothetical protein
MRLLMRVLFIFILISAGLALIRGMLRTLAVSGTKAKVRGPNAADKLVKDPVCGTYIPDHTAFHDGENAFCSEECRTKFLKAG